MAKLDISVAELLSFIRISVLPRVLSNSWLENKRDFSFWTCLCAESPQSCLTLCDPIDCSPLGSSVHGILQARIVKGLPCSSSGNLPLPGIEPTSLISPAMADGYFKPLSTIWEGPI